MDLIVSQVLCIKHAPFSLDEMAAIQGNLPWGNRERNATHENSFPGLFPHGESCSLPAVTDPMRKADHVTPVVKINARLILGLDFLVAVFAAGSELRRQMDNQERSIE